MNFADEIARILDSARAGYVTVTETNIDGKTSTYRVEISRLADFRARVDERTFPSGSVPFRFHSHEVQLPSGETIYFRDTSGRVYIGSGAQKAAADATTRFLRQLGKTAAKAEKEGLVSRAQGLSSSTDWKTTGEQYKRLMEQWKKAGPVDRQDEDRLWRQFQDARQRFFDARKRHFDEMDRQKASAKAAKERLVVRAVNLASSADIRAARNEMRSLVEVWKRAGRADRQDEDRLWRQFQAAHTRLRERGNQEYEQRKRERVSRLEETLRSKKDQRSHLNHRIWEAESQLNEMMSRPSPSFNNPRWSEINNRRSANISKKREQISNLRTKLAGVERSIIDVDQKLREALR